MPTCKKRCLGRYALALIAVCGLAVASGDEEAVRLALDKTIDDAVSVLSDPELKTDEMKSARRQRVRDVLLGATDMRRVGMLTLGPHRTRFSAGQLDAFSDLFTRLVLVTCFRHMDKYRDEDINVLSIELLSKNKAHATGMICYAGKEIPTCISLFKNEQGVWKVYDVNVKGIGFVQNYRAQFHELLSKHGPGDFIAHLTERVNRNQAYL